MPTSSVVAEAQCSIIVLNTLPQTDTEWRVALNGERVQQADSFSVPPKNHTSIASTMVRR